MRPGGCEEDLLRALAEMPFLDRPEMVAVSGWSRGAVYEAVERLETGGFAASVPHATDLVTPTRRFHLTADGLSRLAWEEDIDLDELVLSHPISAAWRRILMERLDALAVMYRLGDAGDGVAYPIRFRWYKSTPLDVSLALPDGRTVVIVRRGLTSDRTAFSNRMRRLRDGPLPGAVLVLMPDEVGLRHARRMLTGAPVPYFLALELEASRQVPTIRCGVRQLSTRPSTCTRSLTGRSREAGFPQNPSRPRRPHRRRHREEAVERGAPDPEGPFRLAQRLRREKPTAAQEHRAHRSRPRLRSGPGEAGGFTGLGDSPARPALESVEALLARREPPLHPPRRLRPPAQGWDDLALLPGVGAPSRAALNHVGAPRALSSLLLVTPAHRRPRNKAPRPGRLRRRHRTYPLPARGAGGDEGKGGDGSAVGLPQGGRGRAGAAGTRLAPPALPPQ